jgi:hypothetical protein
VRGHACKIWATDTKRFCLNPIHDTLGLYTLGTHDQKKNHETYMGSTGIIEFRYGCDRPGMPEKRGFRTIPRCPKVNLVHRIGLAYHLPDNQ